jgi:hypothetical protein
MVESLKIATAIKPKKAKLLITYNQPPVLLYFSKENFNMLSQLVNVFVINDLNLAVFTAWNYGNVIDLT